MVKAARERTQKVAWFELFYDLVAVAAIAQVGKIFLAEPTTSTMFLILGSVVVLFTIWLLTTVIYGLIPSDPIWRKIVILLQMVLVVIGALSVGREGLPNWVGFTAIAGAFATIAIVYWRSQGTDTAVTQSLRALVPFIWVAVGMFSTAAVVSFFATRTESDGIVPTEIWVPVILLVTMAVILAPVIGPFMKKLTKAKAIDFAHFEERFGLLVIIVLGESFISLINSLSKAGSIPSFGFFILTFVVTFSIWSIYFLTVMPAGVPERLNNLRVWVLAHPILLFAAVTTSTAFSDLARVDFSNPFMTEVVEWSPLPILLVMAVILVMMLSQQGSDGIETVEAGGELGDYSSVRTKLVQRQKLVLATQVVATTVVGVLEILDILRPEPGVPWYLVIAAFVVAADAIALALLGRVK